MTEIDRDGLKAAVKAIGDVPGWLVVGLEDAIRAYLEAARPAPVVDDGMMAVVPIFDADKFGETIRVRIAKRNIDMKTAAREIGCSHSSVSRICNGKSPDIENYLRITKWLSETKPPQHSKQLAKHLKVAAKDLKSRPSELRGPFNIKPLNALPEKGEGDVPDPAYMAANAEMHGGEAKISDTISKAVEETRSQPETMRGPFIIKNDDLPPAPEPTVDMEPVTRWVPRTLTGEAVMQTTDTHEGWHSYVKFTDHQARVDALQAERDEARGLVVEANNSLFGSQGYFHSTNGGDYDRHHLSHAIERLKQSGRDEWFRAQEATNSLVALRGKVDQCERELDEMRIMAAQSNKIIEELTEDASVTQKELAKNASDAILRLCAPTSGVDWGMLSDAARNGRVHTNITIERCAKVAKEEILRKGD